MNIKRFKKESRAELDNINIAKMSDEVRAKANAVASTKEPKSKSYSFGRKQALVLSLCSLAVILIVAVSIVTYSTAHRSIVLSDMIARPVSSQKNLQKIIKESQKSDFSISDLRWFNIYKSTEGVMVDEAIAPGAAQGINGSGDTSSNPSQTISQVEGIQESEIVKYDGKYIYYSYHDTIEVYEAANGKADLVKTIELDNCLYHGGDEEELFFNSYFYSEVQMYISDDKLIVITEEQKTDTQTNIARSYWYDYAYRAFDTVVLVYEKGEFNLVKKINVPGYKVDGRLYNNHLYFVTADSIADYEIDTIKEETNGNSETIEIDYENVMYVPSYVNKPYENFICSVDLDSLEAKFECQLGSNSYSTIYMSKNSLYLCDSQYDEGPLQVIYKYDLDEKGFLKYASCGNVPGNIINQYAMDEYNGYLRVVTTGRFSQTSSLKSLTSNVINAVYVLKEVEVSGGKLLEQKGKLDEGIGYPGEQVKSVKFNGEYVSIVTYYQTDPLYLIKFTDDINIAIVDYLKIPGFSTYLLDINISGKAYKLGVGYTDRRDYKLSLYSEENEEVSQVGIDYEIAQYTYEVDAQGNGVATSVYTTVADNIRTMFLYQDSDGNTFVGLNLDVSENSSKDGNKNYGSYLVLKINPEANENVFEPIKRFKTTSYSSRMVADNNYYYVISCHQAKGYTYNSEANTFIEVE